MRTAILMLAILAAPVAAGAMDPVAALTGHRLLVARSTSPDAITFALQPGGVAQRIGRKGRTVSGTWMVQGDRVCMNFPPRHQQCMGSVQELLSAGRTVKTTPSGTQVSVVLQ